MELQEGTSLFEIRLNETGQNYIRKFCRLITPVLIFLILTLVINLCVSVKYILLNIDTDSRGPIRIPLAVKATPYFTIVTSVINFAAVIFYVRFAHSLKRSLAKNDEWMFNESFRYLSQNALLFLVTLITTFLTWGWSLTAGWFLNNF